MLLASASRDETVRLWNPHAGQEVQKLENVRYISELSFTPDSNTLITNRGHLQINTASELALPPEPCIEHGAVLNYDWIECYGEKLLWLPQEYRSDISAFSGNTFAIGRDNGSVTFLRIKYP